METLSWIYISEIAFETLFQPRVFNNFSCASEIVAPLFFKEASSQLATFLEDTIPQSGFDESLFILKESSTLFARD